MTSIRTATMVALLAGAIGMANAEEFKITVTDIGPQPLSPVFFSASDANFNIFTIGGSASVGIKHIAEEGDTSYELAIAAAAGSDVESYGLVGAAPITPGNSATTTFNATTSDPYFSFAAMLGETNDGFIGESTTSAGLKLFDGGGQAENYDYIVTGQRAWDAGTEKDTQNAADLAFLGGTGNPAPDPGDQFIRVHDGVIPGVGDSWQLMPNWTRSTQLAEIQIEAVPEPATWATVGVGFLAILRRRNRKS